MEAPCVDDFLDVYGFTKFDHVRVFDGFEDYSYELYYYELKPVIYHLVALDVDQLH